MMKSSSFLHLFVGNEKNVKNSAELCHMYPFPILQLSHYDIIVFIRLVPLVTPGKQDSKKPITFVLQNSYSYNTC